MNQEAKFFKVLSDPIRLRLAVILALKGEQCVCMLCEALAEPEYKISRHLGIMRSSGVVQARRQGTWSYYSLCHPDSPWLTHMHECLQNCFLDHPAILDDLKRLQHSACNTKTD